MSDSNNEEEVVKKDEDLITDSFKEANVMIKEMELKVDKVDGDNQEAESQEEDMTLEKQQDEKQEDEKEETKEENKEETKEERKEEAKTKDTTNQEDEEEEVKVEETPKQKYTGLGNQGATCYMNSVLQTLFMTPDFRRSIFQWKYIQRHDSNIHTKPETNVPYQLQMLFARLQLRKQKFAYTTGLTKTFGWNAGEGYQQQDVQEFIQHFTDGLRQQFAGSPQENMINDLFQGTNGRFVKSLEEGDNYESFNPSKFSEVQLVVNDPFDNIYNNNIRLALQRLLKASKLEGDNQYQHPILNKKVDALIGERFDQLPPHLMCIINRFTFDMIQMKRVKLHDYVGFPFVLNMNDYMHQPLFSGYDNIPNKLDEQPDLEHFNKLARQNSTVVKDEDKDKDKKDDDKFSISHAKDQDIDHSEVKVENQEQVTGLPPPPAPAPPPPPPASVVGGNVNKGAQTGNQAKQLVDEIAKFKAKQEKQKKKAKIEIEDPQKNVTTQKAEVIEETGKDCGICWGDIAYGGGAAYVEECEHLFCKDCMCSYISISIVKARKEVAICPFSFVDGCNTEITPEAIKKFDIQLGQAFEAIQKGEFFEYVDEKTGKTVSVNTHEKKEEEKEETAIVETEEEKAARLEKAKKLIQENRRKREEARLKRIEERKQMEQNVAVHKEQRDEMVQEFLKDGEFCYELYSILVHRGGAFGGHYYAFIKSFENGRWYEFNDTSVDEMDWTSIAQKCHGGASEMASAYMLFYRKVMEGQEATDIITNEEIPQYIKDAIIKEDEEALKKDADKYRFSSNKNSLTLKVYYADQDVQMVETTKQNTYTELLTQIRKKFKIREKLTNMRLRAYNEKLGVMMDTYEGQEKFALGDMKIQSFKRMKVEVKKEEEVFEEFDINNVCYKVTFWKEGLLSLNKEDLDFEVIMFNQTHKVQKLLILLHDRFNIPLDNLYAWKKQHFIEKADFGLLLGSEDNIKWSLKKLNMHGGSFIYLENTQEGDTLKWPKEFEKDQYRIKIKFNNPQIETPNPDFTKYVIIDKRINIGEMKDAICAKLELEPNEVIMKKQSKWGVEIKNLSKIVEGKYKNNNKVYLKLGIPTLEGQFKVRIRIAYKQKGEKIVDNQLYDLKDLFYMQINHHDPPSEIIKQIVAKAQKDKELDLNPDHCRLRQEFMSRLNKIYRKNPMKDQGVNEKTTIAIEVLDQPPPEIKFRQQLVLVRFWDPVKWKLSDPYEFIMGQTQTNLDLLKEIAPLCPNIKEEDIEITRIFALHHFNQMNLVTQQEWRLLSEGEFTLESSQFVIATDGLCFIVKDQNIDPQPLNEEEIKALGISEVKSYSGGTVFRVQGPKKYTSGSYKPAPEVGISLKIKTKQEEIEEEKEREQKEKEEKEEKEKKEKQEKEAKEDKENMKKEQDDEEEDTQDKVKEEKDTKVTKQADVFVGNIEDLI